MPRQRAEARILSGVVPPTSPSLRFACRTLLCRKMGRLRRYPAFAILWRPRKYQPRCVVRWARATLRTAKMSSSRRIWTRCPKKKISKHGRHIARRNAPRRMGKVVEIMGNRRSESRPEKGRARNGFHRRTGNGTGAPAAPAKRNVMAGLLRPRGL